MNDNFKIEVRHSRESGNPASFGSFKAAGFLPAYTILRPLQRAASRNPLVGQERRVICLPSFINE